MKDFIAGIVEKLGTKLIGSIVTKLVTIAAAALVSHNLMKPATQESWVAANVDWLTGLALGALSLWLSKWRQKEQVKVNEAALYTAPPGYVLLPVEQAPQQNFSGGGIRAGEESIAPDKFRPEEHL